jgi:hypothetical protein
MFCETIGDTSQSDWEEAPGWQKDSAISGVRYRLDNPHDSAEAQHIRWMQDKLDDGWVYGDVKDSDKKTHPCLVPYADLPIEQQLKDSLFISIVEALRPLTETYT